MSDKVDFREKKITKPEKLCSDKRVNALRRHSTLNVHAKYNRAVKICEAKMDRSQNRNRQIHNHSWKLQLVGQLERILARIQKNSITPSTNRILTFIEHSTQQ